MSRDLIPFDKYPALPSLFREFLKSSPHFPDPPTLPAAVARGTELAGRAARLPATAFRWRHPGGEKMARDLGSGAAVAVVAGHQVGLFTGPLFTLTKALDAIRVARQMTERGRPAVPVFYALTDDHDLEEVAKTARPDPEGPEILVLEGADRSNRRPVGQLPLPAGIVPIVEAFRADARSQESSQILDAFARRSAPGTTYADAFVETLFDLLTEPILVLDPMAPAARAAAAELLERGAAHAEEIRLSLAATDAALRREGLDVPVPDRAEVFPFFIVEDGERRRIEDPKSAVRQTSEQRAWASADVLTRPILKSFLVPTAATILGPAEIAYHAQSLPLFPLFDVRPPVLMPRSHIVLLGPAERRVAEALGIAREDLLIAQPGESRPTPEADQVDSLARDTDERLRVFAETLQVLDPTLEGALETSRRKVAYQMAQLKERIQKAASRKDEVSQKRYRRLETMVRPGGSAAERLYPPIVPLMAFGPAALDAIRAGATGSLEGGVIVDIDATPGADKESEAHRAD